MSTSPTTALVLSGGGARGAYEAGVLRWMARELPSHLSKGMHFDVIAGTSVGALNGAFLAAESRRPCHGGGLLADLWSNIGLQDIYSVTAGTLWSHIGGLLSLGKGVGSVVDARPLQRLVREQISWSSLRDARAAGAFQAVVVTATEIATSRNIVFVDSDEIPDAFFRSSNPSIRPRQVSLGPEHVLASAAIPFLLPPVEIDGSWFLDGGLGQQTPLRPALRLGASRVLVVSLRRLQSEEALDEVETERGGEPPGWAQVAGKALNAVLLDNAEHDIRRMKRINSIMRWGTERFGPDFARELSAFTEQERGAAWHPVESLLLAPTEDLGHLAIDYIRGGHLRTGTAMTRRLLRAFADAGSAAENDLLSYMLFDPGFIDHLLNLGERDAEAQANRLVAFFEEPAVE